MLIKEVALWRSCNKTLYGLYRNSFVIGAANNAWICCKKLFGMQLTHFFMLFFAENLFFAEFLHSDVCW